MILTNEGGHPYQTKCVSQLEDFFEAQQMFWGGVTIAFVKTICPEVTL